MSEILLHSEVLLEIKESIRRSRYLAAKAVNKELVLLYYSIGRILSIKISEAEWGGKILEKISIEIKEEFKGIRGYSVSNLKNMRQFYREYQALQFSQLSTVQLDLINNSKNSTDADGFTIGQLSTAELGFCDKEQFIKTFFSTSFTAHILLINRCHDWQERFFYMRYNAHNQWTVELLEYHLDTDFFKTAGSIQNNFAQTLPDKIKKNAINAFRDEVLLNFIQVDDENDELAVENAIVQNVKKFMLALGREFTFMGNQYRLVVDEDEFFIDLLFYHRGLQAMVAIELKTGKFKPEHAGKMNFYLAALDELVKLPHENPSIGIILCKTKSRAIVEFAFKYTDAPVGVATYKIANKLPDQLKKFLPTEQDFKKLLEDKDE